MNDFSKMILVTGGAGFIGSNFLLRLVRRYPQYYFINVDALTYAGVLENLAEIDGAENYAFEHADITDADAVAEIFRRYPITHVVHFAAESHVDRSIHDPFAFVRTNVLGTVTLLHQALNSWEGNFDGKRFFHVSTDEVYGSLSPDADAFSELNRYEPHSPYSASKASADHFVRAYHDTYGLPVLISNCSNNYGPFQFPEKLIPLCINNILHQKPLPIYGDGTQVRDWLYVTDHVDAIDTILHQGKVGETYNVGGKNEIRNIDLVKTLIKIVDSKLGNPEGHSLRLIQFVTDRPGHDTRYAIDATKIEKELGWAPKLTPEEGLEKTVEWYLTHDEWLNKVTSGAYQSYYEEMYKQRIDKEI